MMNVSCNCIPAGVVMHLATLNVPTGWLECDGSEVSQKDYPALYEAIGNVFGEVACPGMFKLPDLRGQFVRGFDKTATVDEKREFGSKQGDAIRNITGRSASNYGAYQGNASGAFRSVETSSSRSSNYASNAYYQSQEFDASLVVPTAHENRPVNVALLACIKY